MSHWCPDELKWFRDKENIELKLKDKLKIKENSFITITGFLCELSNYKNKYYIYRAIYKDKDTQEKEKMTVNIGEKEHRQLQTCYWLFN